MNSSRIQRNAVSCVSNNGLEVTDHGLQGLVLETTSGHHFAEKRHERVIDFLGTCKDAPPGGLLLILLVANEMVMTGVSLKAAVSPTAKIYAAGAQKYLEWPMGNGWMDRRELSIQTVAAIARNGGCTVKDVDWKWAVGFLRQIHPERALHEAWSGFIGDAQAWWVTRVTGPIFGHAIGLRPLQPLSRAALARRHSGNPLISEASSISCLADDLELFQTVRSHSKVTSTLDGLILFAGQVARDKRPKDHGRARIVERINMLLPLAVREGRVQVIVLGAIRHALENGGVRGDKWAPITVYEYLRQGLKELALALLEIDIDGLNGWEWQHIYKQILERIRESQRPKFAAFLEVFHRFLVIAGFDPLPRSLSGSQVVLPPAAAVVWPHELKNAIAYIEVYAASPRIRLQATLGLVLGFWIPLRTIELWCIRLGDVFLNEQVYLTIYPRRVDGVGKTASLRRQEEVQDSQLKTLLIDMVNLRRQDGADDGDVLLGEPGKPGARHEEMATALLMNAALRWATGDQTASFYDLRHSAFSRRAEPILLGGMDETDVAQFQQLSAQGGHAGPSSTASYIHWIENVIATLSRASRPDDLGAACECSEKFQFEDIGKGLIADGLPPFASPDPNKPEQDTSFRLTLEKRADILWRVSENLPLESVAGVCDVPPTTVHQVISDLVQTMVQLQMFRFSATGSLRKQCQAINSKALWARAAKQKKNETIRKAISELIAAGQWSRLHLLWQDLTMCQSGSFISLANPRPSVRLIEFLLSAGVPKQSLLIISATDAPPLSEVIEKLKIETRPVAPRKGRAMNRLFMAEPGVCARDAKAATISMVGFHWLMLLLGSILFERGEI